MDAEIRARRQSRRVIISEIIMVVTVVLTVLILAFVVSGYWVNSDFEIERQGLLQIYSAPTGADVTVDGSTSSWLQRTNTSKTLSAGEHTISLTKDGYDSWSRTINITEGLLYRLHYPRLFPLERAEESACEFSANFVTITPDRNTMLLADGTTTWRLFNLDSDSAKLARLDLAEVLPFTTRAVAEPSTAESAATDSSGTPKGTFNGVIESAEWATDNEHVLLRLKSENTVNWFLLNIKNPTASINLTWQFNAEFSQIEILNSSASSLLVMMDGNLHRVDVSAKQVSAVLVSDVRSFDYFDQTVVFSAKNSEKSINSPSAHPDPAKESAGDSSIAETDSAVEINPAKAAESSPYYIGLLKLGDSNVTRLAPADNPQQVVITKFYDDEYIAVLDGAALTLYLKKDFEKKADFTLSFRPEHIKVGTEGEVITYYTGGQIATLDMEATNLTEWSTDTDSFGWLDGSMVYAVKDGVLNVYDFNGLNHRTLSTDVSNKFPVTITSDKYLYYFRGTTLTREWLVER